MFDLDDMKEGLTGFSLKDFREEKPVLFALLCLICILFLIGLIILLIQNTPEHSTVRESEHFEADAPVIIPDQPQIEKQYYLSRETSGKWSRKESDKWFTYPEEDVMKDLKESNDKMVQDILGAAP